ncbi:MAG: hypothetical protein QOK05_2356 [Chloroflexota bacterium]|nr:hypothetical protein [Chloroflexota bacterium]
MHEQNEQQPQATGARPYDALTPAELAVLRLLATGRNNDEIATVLKKSRGTVKHQLSSVLRKLELRDRVAAVVWWYTTGTDARK